MHILKMNPLTKKTKNKKQKQNNKNKKQKQKQKQTNKQTKQTNKQTNTCATNNAHIKIHFESFHYVTSHSSF